MDRPARLGLKREGQENRLGSVLCVMTVGRDAVSDAVDHASIPAHDLLERSLGAVLYKLSQELVSALLREELLFPQGLTLA